MARKSLPRTGSTFLRSMTACWLLIAVAAFWPQPAQGDPASGKPKTIVLGFDGASGRLTKQWMDEGFLPNMKRLAEMGAFSPLGTANPAQSPVSWAVMETASNPGKTNIPDFVRKSVQTSSGNPGPRLAGVYKKMVDAADVEKYVPLKRAEKLMMWVATEKNRPKAIALVAGAVFVLFFLIFCFVLRVKGGRAAVIALLVAAIGALALRSAVSQIPPRFPVPVPEMQGERFWDVLAKSGVKFTGLQVPAAFPASTEEGARLLSGLFTPDVQGGPGAWSIYTNDEWAQSRPEPTETGGTRFKIWEDKDGVYRTKIDGPENFIKKDGFDRILETIEKEMKEPGISDERRDQLKEQREEVRSKYEDWSNNERRSKVDLWIKPDFKKREATITIDGKSQTVAEGDWSECYRVKFELSRLLGIDAIPYVYVSECHVDQDENKKLKLFMPPISISPEVQPPVLPISSPREFVAEIEQDVGLFDTIGWACWTNALKDEEIDEKCFLSGLTKTLTWRTKQLEHELAKNDWDVLFHVESVTDRAGHMFYRFLDPKHPMYDLKTKDGKLVREMEFEAFGRKIKLQDAIKETYKEMDRIIGSVLDRIEAGKFGPGASLFVISDHGFDSFRWGVNLNNWLERAGYLVLNEGALDAIKNQSVGGLLGGQLSIDYPDWTKTKAYSLGLGKIYLNIKGREPNGIVEPGEVEALKAEIIAKLEAFKDPRPGFQDEHPVLRAYNGLEIYSGPYAAEPGDIILGFNSGYRVSWQTSLGGFEVATRDTWGIAPNPQPWTGDHCGVDPSLVKGIYFSNRKLPAGFEPSLLNIAPTVLKIYGVTQPKEWDGTPIDLK